MSDSRLAAIDWATHQQEAMAAYYAGPAQAPDGTGEGIDPPLDRERLRPSGFAEWFALSQTLLPALLFLPGSQAFRLPVRVGAYAISLYAFAMWWFRRARRPANHHPGDR